jgi:hypothetical protein
VLFPGLHSGRHKGVMLLTFLRSKCGEKVSKCTAKDIIVIVCN